MVDDAEPELINEDRPSYYSCTLNPSPPKYVFVEHTTYAEYFSDHGHDAQY